MGAMPQSSAERNGTATPRKEWVSSTSTSPLVTKAPVRRKPVGLKVDVEGASVVKHMVEKPRQQEASTFLQPVVTKPRQQEASTFLQPVVAKPRHQEASTFLQPENFKSELKVRTGVRPAANVAAVSDSPKSARSVRSIRASFETPRNVVKEPPSPSPSPRNGTKPLEWNGVKRGARSVVLQQSETEYETFYDSLPTLDPPDSPSSQFSGELPKLELSFEGKPAPAPSHLRVRTQASTSPLSAAAPAPSQLRVRTASTLPLSEKQWEPSSQDPPVESESPSSHSTSRGDPSPALLKVRASASLLGDGNSMRERLRSASTRKESPAGEGDSRAVHSFRGLPSRPTLEVAEPKVDVKPKVGVTPRVDVKPRVDVEPKVDVKPAGLLRRMMHWGASKLGKKSSSKVSSGAKTGGIGVQTEPQIADQVQSKVEPESVKEAEKPVENSIPPAEDDSPRSSVSSVSTTYSEVSSKSHSHKHKKHSKSELVKSKLWLLRVHQKLHGRKDFDDDFSDSGMPTAVRGATFHGYPVDTSAGDKTVDKNMVMGSARFNSEKHKSKDNSGSRHRRNSTWDAGKLSNVTVTEDLFSPKQKLPKREEQGLLTPPRQLPGEATEFAQRRRRPTSLITDSSTSLPDNSPSPRKPRHVNSRVAPDHQAPDSSTTTRRHVSGPLSMSAPAGTFLQTAALILATPGKDEPNNQLFEKSRKISTSNPPVDTTPPISPTGLSERTSFKGFNLPALPLPGRVGTQLSPTSVSPRFIKSPPGRYDGASSTPTSPGMLASSPAWSGMQSSPSSPGIFVPSPQWVHSQSSPKFHQDHPSPTSQPWTHTRSQQLEEPSISKPVKRPPKSEEPAATSPRSQLPLPTGIASFEQIVAGRNRSPPTDNTLMKFFFKCREIDHLNKFLALQKKRFLESLNTDSAKSFHMILSEAGQGLSSMISTLCTAWLVENTMASASVKWHPIPVMNMCQKEMWQHRDAAWLFHVCGIDSSALLFLDEVAMIPDTAVAGRVKRAVAGQDILQTKDEVASSCTIVSEKFRTEAPKLLQARYMKTLLLAGILVDTQNLSTGSLRDKQQATILLVGAGSLGRNGFYKHLVNIRDENYVTTFIKEIYGDSSNLAVEQHSAPRGRGVEPSKPMSRPTSIITVEESPKRASRKSEAAPARSKSAATETKNKLSKTWFRNRSPSSAQ